MWIVGVLDLKLTARERGKEDKAGRKGKKKQLSLLRLSRCHACVYPIRFNPTFDGPTRPRTDHNPHWPSRVDTSTDIDLFSFCFFLSFFFFFSYHLPPSLSYTFPTPKRLTIMSTPLERQLLESHRQLLATYLGSLTPEQLRAAILDQASSGPEAMLASVHQLTHNNPNNPHNSDNSDKNAAEGALPINTAPTVMAPANQESIASREVGADQIMKEKERNDTDVQGKSPSVTVQRLVPNDELIDQDQKDDVDDDDLVEIIDDPQTRGNRRRTGRAPKRKTFAEADESELSDYEYQSSENTDHGENEKATSTAYSKKRKSRKASGKKPCSGLRLADRAVQPRGKLARIAFTVAFAERYAWPAPDVASCKAALTRAPPPSVSIAVPSFHSDPLV